MKKETFELLEYFEGLIQYIWNTEGQEEFELRMNDLRGLIESYDKRLVLLKGMGGIST